MMSTDYKAAWSGKASAIRKSVEMRLFSLSQWEASFMDSIEQRILKGEDLPIQQSIKLNEIYRRVQ